MNRKQPYWIKKVKIQGKNNEFFTIEIIFIEKKYKWGKSIEPSKDSKFILNQFFY